MKKPGGCDGQTAGRQWNDESIFKEVTKRPQVVLAGHCWSEMLMGDRGHTSTRNCSHRPYWRWNHVHPRQSRDIMGA